MNNIRKLISKVRKSNVTSSKVMQVITSAATFVWLLPYVVFADEPSTGAATITSSFNTLFGIVSALVSAIGSIILLWGIFEWGVSLQSQDGVTQSSAFKRIGGGLVMVLAPQLITAFVTI